ncbi:Dabb family protein [Uliginosibacterium sp. sgz301328]|uniref:Dabb family protein n=1 Tax=Uliginosibacterium sp. sgz301328 TaxID=3243764 RepID=UPI00359D1135
MIRHIVMWRLKAEDAEQRAADILAIREALEALNGRIDGMRLLEVRADFSREATSADLMLYSEFDSRAALDAYQDHPEHVAAKAVVAPRVSERRLADVES